jgi:protoporphyrinogen oxidase
MERLDSKELTIVGGGITGLTAAYIAAKAGSKVRVLEGSDSFGGLIKTFDVGETPVECFYHHFFLHDKELGWLIKELGIEDKIISRKTSMGVFTQGKVYLFSTIKDLFAFKPLNLIDKLRFGLSTIYLGKFANWRKSEDKTALDWFKKWTGKNVVDSIWKPLLKVKFGKFHNQVPLAWMIGRLKQRFESREAGSEKLLYIDGSYSVLLDQLLLKLKELGVELLANSKVDALVYDANKLIGVQVGVETYYSEKTLFTIPNNITQKLLGNQLKLPEIEYFGAVCVILELTKSLSPVYWLNVADDNFPFGGIIEHTRFISPENYGNKHIVYLSKYFALDEPIATLSESEIETLMLDKLPAIFPDFKKENLLKTHVFRSFSAATVCDLNFSTKVPNVKTTVENLFVCNMAHVYPDERSVNNSIRIAANACISMGINAGNVPNGNSLSGKIGFN